MRFRTLALALALSVGATGLVQASPKKTTVSRAKPRKAKKVKPGKRVKTPKAAKTKAHKAKRPKHAKA